MSAIQVSLYTQRKYGKTLCADCGAKAKEIKYEENTKDEVEDILKGDEN